VRIKKRLNQGSGGLSTEAGGRNEKRSSPFGLSWGGGETVWEFLIGWYSGRKRNKHIWLDPVKRGFLGSHQPFARSDSRPHEAIRQIGKKGEGKKGLYREKATSKRIFFIKKKTEWKLPEENR